MIRRIKRLFGFTARGSYFPHDDVLPDDNGIIATPSRKNVKSDKKEKSKKALKSKKSAPAALITDDRETTFLPKSAANQTVPEIIIGGDDSLHHSECETNAATDSLPYREPSDKSQRFTNSRSSAAPSSVREAASNRSLAGSETTKSLDVNLKGEISKNGSYVDSEYSTETNNDEERLVDGGILEPPHDPYSQASLLCVNTPEVPIEFGTAEEFKREENKFNMSTSKTDVEMERKIQEMNEQLEDILKKPAPFNVSTARLPALKTFADLSCDDTVGSDDFDEKNNSRTPRGRSTDEQQRQSGRRCASDMRPSDDIVRADTVIRPRGIRYVRPRGVREFSIIGVRSDSAARPLQRPRGVRCDLPSCIQMCGNSK
ncbi:unnamed protein product [Caenorhabditis bovis]|uniref:Uncharacterized protein n=1 Tax=Caenorhabditis bovis TaxID=2654633 RepID=A0A8S1EXU3_9PELO|nr:unnamed protein product [Caenorhabditis bovis]